MKKQEPLFLGIDLGTQGVRCLVSTPQGEIVAEGKEKISHIYREGEQFEQEPEEWWEVTTKALREALRNLREKGKDPNSIQALSCDSTSGTVLALNREGQALSRAIMYNDGRAKEEAEIINREATSFTERLGYQFGASFALAKILWWKRNNPELFDKAHLFLHAADFIVGKLTGEWGISDTSNSLKMGYDLIDFKWPSFIETQLGISISKLPQVVNPGEVVGKIRPQVAQELSLSPHCKVVAGCTDGTASFLASGATRPGDTSCALGTTLVVRSISYRLIKDPEGRIYCHRHPEGYWLPGGASNTGGECLEVYFPGEDYQKWDEKISQDNLPTSILLYPLTRRGERLPFSSGEACFFQIGKEKNREEFYAACLEGVGYIERLSLELLENLGADPITRVFASGGGSRSSIWRKIRANILNRPIFLAQTTESAFGSCILSASLFWGKISRAVQEMVHLSGVEKPHPLLSSLYEERYQAFLMECKKRGYIS
ncbi:MAG TPA: FGGY-family carbohydrate kinase [Candidatus Atribacteria bacterium]|nr:FGGY-family carbohydrate kinase [Candidatus Atribacteria bacterium]